ncbi:hypothetical protein [Schaalia vaccimaxillae]|uniref:hypothetical protein n=1 Tax=Schaalia vaccimaxillae TaxID=183916 RepID=UPI0003B73A64|nr:hypothetical protein [Schaalia vaccimaxillae]
MTWTQFLVFFSGLLVAVALGWALTILVLRVARVSDAASTTVESADGPARLLEYQPQPSHILRGGRWIGILERIAVYLCIVTGTPVLISAVIAVKGLGRYPELRENPAAAERFLIGTGVSILVAVLTGLAALEISNLLT